MTLKHNQDVAGTLVTVLDHLLEVTGFVFGRIKGMMKVLKLDYNQDMFDLCTLAIDNGLIDIASGLLALTETVTPAKLSLGADGTVQTEGEKVVTSTPVEKMDVAGPTPVLTFVSTVMQSIPLVSALGKLVTDAQEAFEEISDEPEKNLEEL
ncbi:MAG: hypothetical protein LBC31_12885 [Treponema sp.]|jgi:hypothetical protein|nr:hypothetical protein [Treponema sp.]